MTDIRRERTSADIKSYMERGLKCSLWNVPVQDMDRDELIGFIGFLDELATERGHIPQHLHLADVKGPAR